MFTSLFDFGFVFFFFFFFLYVCMRFGLQLDQKQHCWKSPEPSSLPISSPWLFKDLRFKHELLRTASQRTQFSMLCQRRTLQRTYTVYSSCLKLKDAPKGPCVRVSVILLYKHEITDKKYIKKRDDNVMERAIPCKFIRAE